MIVESINGGYYNIRMKQDENENDIRLEMYNINEHYYTFFFSMINDKDIRNRKHQYFALRKTHEEIHAMGEDNHKSLIAMDTELSVIQVNQFNKSEIDIVKDYTKKTNFRQLEASQNDRMFEQSSSILLTFEKIFDNKSHIDFIPIIYQEKGSMDSHHIILFDVERMEVVRHAVTLPNMEMRKCMRKTFTGFYQYTITRTSEVYKDSYGFMHSHHGQNAKYQISCLCYLKKKQPFEHHEPGFEEEQPENAS
jgi:hypothetical protein